ncbi:MAG: four helix bundle protein [Nitrospirae bacterium]|nr:four helix bundle protein [Nitrospirota bacterium]
MQEIYRASNDGRFAKDYGLRDQLRRAAVSIMLNIAEGFARKTNKEFMQFLVVAHGSAAEVQSALYVALDQKYVSQEQFTKLYALTDHTSKMVIGFASYLRKSMSARQNAVNPKNSISSMNS